MKSPMLLSYEYFYDQPVCAHYTFILIYDCTVYNIYIDINIVVTDITRFHSHHQLRPIVVHRMHKKLGPTFNVTKSELTRSRNIINNNIILPDVSCSLLFGAIIIGR